jgi:hypothetical protein
MKLDTQFFIFDTFCEHPIYTQKYAHRNLILSSDTVFITIGLIVKF